MASTWYAASKRVVIVMSLMVVMLQSQGDRGRVAAWGMDGHYLVCAIAQTMFTQATIDGINELIPNGELANWCSWPDQVRRRIRWSGPLHFINTPEVCNYNHHRDCQAKDVPDMCLSGAITNYTSQLADYKSSGSSSYNMTEALLFLAHFVGDIHQPLHVSFADDRGANTIFVHFFNRKYNLHSVWDSHMIDHAVTNLYDSEFQAFQDAIVQNITDTDREQWSKCYKDQLPCPDKYARESIKDACNWAYQDAPAGTYLDESYFDSRLPVIERKLSQGGVRLASILNSVFS